MRALAGSVLLLCILGCGSLRSPVVADAWNRETFDELRARLTPDASDPWRTIPWRLSLLEAQRIAAAERKPLFIWAMDGHPLGCT